MYLSCSAVWIKWKTTTTATKEVQIFINYYRREILSGYHQQQDLAMEKLAAHQA